MIMRWTALGSRMIQFALCLSCLTTPFAGGAQSRPRTASRRTLSTEYGPAAPRPSAEVSSLSELGDTVAILPWAYKNGKEAAFQSAREVCNQLLLETGMNVLLIKTQTGAMPPAMPGNQRRTPSPIDQLLNSGRFMLGQEVGNGSSTPFVLPTLEQMTEVGEKLGTRYVLAGRAQWTSRYVWVGISNRVKSICTVDILILDRSSKQLVLSAKNVVGDSTENKSPFNTITSAISLNPLPLLMPGSLTPQEQHAVSVAVAKAMEPWLKTERIRVAIDQADQSGQSPDLRDRQTVKFSTLVSRINDLEMHLHVTMQNPKQIDAMDSGLAKLFALGDVSLQYKAPDRLRFSASSPKDGEETLLFDGNRREWIVPDRKTDHRQDLSTAPFRRLSLLDFSGLLPTGLFSIMRARFVRPETIAGVHTAVYDLTYWGVEDGPFDRVWIDAATRLVVRREHYEKGGKLKFITHYQQTKQVAGHFQLPDRIKIEDANHKRIASIQLTAAKVNPGLDDDLFSTASRKR